MFESMFVYMCVYIYIYIYIYRYHTITDVYKAALLPIKPSSDDDCGCNIMAKGFRFMPLGLVKLRTFQLSAWVT